MEGILYSTSLLLLSIIVLKIVFTEGRWVGQQFHWLWLSFVCVLVAGFRHNGVPVAFLTLVFLIPLYRKWCKPLLLSLVVFSGLWYFFQGPALDLLNVEKSYGTEKSIFIHHIAAHIINGGPLSVDEQVVANKIIPEGNWLYDCCSAISIRRAEGFSEVRNELIFKDIQRLALKLAVKEPGIEIAHQLCISSIVWEIPNHCGNKTLLPYTQSLWIRGNNLNLKENSLFPEFLPWLSKILMIQKDDSRYNALLSPSIYLFLTLYISFFTAFK